MRDDSIPVVRPQDIRVTTDALNAIDYADALRYSVCPISLVDRAGTRILTVAVADPGNLPLLDQLKRLTGFRIAPVRASQADIIHAISVHYPNSTVTPARPTDLLREMGNIAESLGDASELASASKTIDNLLQQAAGARATDVHIEPYQDVVIVRFRVDGILYDHTTYEPTGHQQMISRVKILAQLDIGQNRLPQDGRFPFVHNKKEYDVRVSLVPSISGEKAVLRLLPKGVLELDFAQLGINKAHQQLLTELLSRPYGMLLSSGPTGCGKTTTLYSCLTKIDCVARNVMTIEDPVEYQFPRMTQIQVNPKIGLTFAAGLRSMLRQDPDIIMVGEIRDPETLQMAIQSSLTGHLVFSTLHCNDAVAGATRMIDMGAEPFLVASSINAIIAQRLVRKICEHCRERDNVFDDIKQKLGLTAADTVFYRGRGCGRCRNTGYSGRIGIFEIIPFIDQLKFGIMRKQSSGELRTIIAEAGYPDLRADALAKARAGITSLSEVMRAVYIEEGM